MFSVCSDDTASSCDIVIGIFIRQTIINRGKCPYKAVDLDNLNEV